MRKSIFKVRILVLLTFEVTILILQYFEVQIESKFLRLSTLELKIQLTFEYQFPIKMHSSTHILMIFMNSYRSVDYKLVRKSLLAEKKQLMRLLSASKL